MEKVRNSVAEADCEEQSRLLDDLEKIDNARVLDVLQDLDLARYSLHVTLISNTLLLEHLDGHALAGDLVHAKFYFAKSALANGFG